MKIYTGGGDTGETSLFSGERVDKHSPRVDTYGTLDELNAVLGTALAACSNAEVLDALRKLQHRLFRLGADLATRPMGKRAVDRIQAADWKELESLIDRFQDRLPPLKDFVLPGGSLGAAFIHLGRVVCRRAERRLTALMKIEGDINPEILVFLNRLSDLLFVMARYENIEERGKEEIWQKEI